MEARAPNPEAAAALDRLQQFAFPEGRAAPKAVVIGQAGEMCLAPRRRWLAFTAIQHFDALGAGFVWTARFHLLGVQLQVTDAFEAGRGSTRLRIFGVLPVSRARGPAIDQGAAMRGLAELIWHPAAFVPHPHLTWDRTGSGFLRATYNDGRTRAAVDFQLGAEGQVIAVSAPNRPYLAGKRVVERPWSGRVYEYTRFGVMRLPARAEASWLLPEGEFTYFRARVTDARAV